MAHPHPELSWHIILTVLFGNHEPSAPMGGKWSSIVEVVEARFGSVPAERRTRVQAVDDAEVLRAWRGWAIRCGSVSELGRDASA